MDVVEEIKRAIEYTKQKKYKKSEEIYRSILKLDPENVMALSCLGLLYLNIGLFKKSEKYLEKSNQIQTSNSVKEGLALVKYYSNKTDEAIKYFEEVISTTKNYDIYDKYITVLIDRKKYKKAYEIAQKATELFPIKKEAKHNFIYCSICVGKLKESFKLAEQLVRQYPKYSQGWDILGLLYEMLYHDEDMAKRCYKMILKCGNKNEAYYNLAINANKNNDYKKALYYAKKIKTNTINETSKNFLLASIYFRQRKYKKGYEYYVKKENKFDTTRIDKSKFWNGKTYKKETLLVHCDQGVGDCIMFSRYLPFLSKKFKTVKIFLPKSIMGLYKRAFKKYTNFQYYKLSKRHPSCDKYTILSNLPHYLNKPLSNIPYSKGYYCASKTKVKKYKDIINSPKYKVGIVWEAGAAGWRELLNRTLNISMFEPFLKNKNVQYYSLQVNPAMDNYKEYDIIDLGKDFKDFDDTAGALMNLDLIITVDTSVAHLAGALGVKTFMLLPYCPDWRWFDNDKKTEWYDSITIFKQKNSKSWDNVINNVKTELDKLVK